MTTTRLGKSAGGAICLALLAAWPAVGQIPPPPRAAFSAEPASDETRRLADWIVASGDNHSLPFLIVDKIDARVFAFDAHGLIRRSAPALLGLAKGDVSPPGIGARKLAQITPAERITPSGRFEASLGRNLSAKDILWIDYDAAISLHAVVAGTTAERRAQRLASPTAIDNRISYGCINVPAAFFAEVVQPLFKAANGVVYILPELKP